MTDEQYKAYLTSPKWKAIAKRRLEIDGYVCQACGSRGTTDNPLEIHHLSYKYIGNEESRIYEDLVTLCHICHKHIHHVMNRITSAEGRRGWKDADIPNVHTYTISGAEILNR